MKGDSTKEKMENEQIKQYLISFAEETLNRCNIFAKNYGKDFVRQRLEKNLKKVYTDLYHRSDNGQYSLRDLSIRIFSENENAKPLTINDIKSNYNLQHDILHESIHAVFKRTDEETESIGIKDGTGLMEFHDSGIPVGKGLNEGLTEWICKKAGYPLKVYEAETNIVELLELAVGEDKIIQLANGDIKRNATELLEMSKEDLEKMLNQVDYVCKKESDIEQINRITSILSKGKSGDELKEELGTDYEKYSQMIRNMKYFRKNVNGNDVNEQIKYLRELLENEKKDKDFHVGFSIKEDIYLRYFDREIEGLQNKKNISKETMNRLTELYNNISEDEAIHSTVLSRFKNELYPELQSKVAVVSESKFAEIYGKAKGNISQVFGKIKAFFVNKTNTKSNDNRELDEH